MKKIATILTALALMLSFAACGKTDKKPDSTSDASQTENTTVTTEPTTDTSAPETDAASDPKALLDAIWNNYKEDDKFPAAGGDYDEANMVDGAPGNVGLADADSVEHLTGFPAASIGEIDAAASLFHMMNGNSFTCGAYRVKEGTDVDALAQSIRTISAIRCSRYTPRPPSSSTNRSNNRGDRRCCFQVYRFCITFCRAFCCSIWSPRGN